MRVLPVKTDKILPGQVDILSIIDKSVADLADDTVLAVTSKVVSLCEGRIAPLSADREELIRRHSDQYLPAEQSRYGHHFTITDNTLIAGAGIDESNSACYYVLWPEDSQATANNIRRHLAERFDIKNLGVIIVDSTCQPLRRGASGIALAHSGFRAINDYRGQPDLFDRPFSVSVANISGGLAAAAVLAMGEGSEQTPLALINDVSFVEFQNRDPSAEELDFIRLSVADDLFAPFLENAGWQAGDHSSR